MSRKNLAAAITLLSTTFGLSLLASPVSVAAEAPTGHVIPALNSDGTFHGTPGVEGSVDSAAWTLVSDLAAGEAPRFAPAPGPWTTLGSNGVGNGALNSVVYAIAVIGTDIYVGGNFTNAASIPEADYIAKWDGSSWSALGSDGAGNGALNLFVNALSVNGDDLYVGGDFANAGGNPTADMIAKWDGSTWSGLGSNGSGNGAFGINSYVYSIAIYKGDIVAIARGPVVVAGGGTRSGLVRYTGGGWTDVGDWSNSCDFLLASGNFLYMASGGVARWDGTSWIYLGGVGADGLGGGVNVIAVSGSTIYAGGSFQNAGGHPEADYVAKWDGNNWSALGSNGAGNGALNQYVYGLAVHGSDLYIAGDFFNAANIPEADAIAKWNGSSWSAVGSNGAGNGAFNGAGRTLTIAGSNLYAGGGFQNVGGILTADFVAAWKLADLPPVVVRKPDALIRVGTTGAFLGNNVYNRTGASQSRTKSAKRGKTITFGISIQNDGTAEDGFKVKATGSPASKYTVKYSRGGTDITAKVVAGTYTTTPLAPGASFLITAKVKVKATAKAGSKVTRLVTITSAGSASTKDAVKLIAKCSK